MLSQRSNINATLVKISKEMLNEDSTVPIWRAIEEIKRVKAAAILLYTSERRMALMLQQVIQPLDWMSFYCNIQKVYFIGVYLSNIRSYLFLVRLLVETNSTNGYFKDRFENQCCVINQSVFVMIKYFTLITVITFSHCRFR